MKKIAFTLAVIIVIIIGLISGFVSGILEAEDEMGNKQDLSESAKEMQVESYDVSKKFAQAMLQMEEVLTTDPKKVRYTEWESKIKKTIDLWDELEVMTKSLDETAQDVILEEEIKQSLNSFKINKARAVESQEILAVFDAAPAGKRLRTLAKHLGVDARRARSMLKIAQGQTTSASWNKAGDTFEKLENTARVIKDGSKVGLYVGGAIMTGGATSTVGTILAEGGAIIGGADLVLEIGEDVSSIAFGYNSEATAVFSGARKITEPTATVIGLFSLDADAFDSVMFGIDQINSAIQENKYLGISVDFEKAALTADGMDKDEMKTWLKEKDIPEKPDPPSEILGIGNISDIKIETKKNDKAIEDNDDVVIDDVSDVVEDGIIEVEDSGSTDVPTIGAILGTWDNYIDGSVTLRYVMTPADNDDEGVLDVYVATYDDETSASETGGSFKVENSKYVFYNANRTKVATAIIEDRNTTLANEKLHVTYVSGDLAHKTLIFTRNMNN